MQHPMMLLPLLLACSGCAHEQKGVRVQIQEKIVEVQKPCPVTIPERPATLKASDLPPDARDALRIAIAALLGWQGDGGYGDKADAALRICVRASE